MSSHEEWLSLIEVSGPFLTVPVLERVFPQGLDVLDREIAPRLRSAHEEWAEARERGGNEAKAIHRAWIEMVFREALGFDEEVLLADRRIPDGTHVEVAEHHERLSPDYVIANPPGGWDEGKSRLLVQVWPASQDLSATVEGRSWSASPAERMTTLCRAAGIRLGLVTNGERWMLVDAPLGETAGYASWYASLWSQEPLTLRAFQSLFSARRFFGVAEKDTLEAMLTESVAYQQEVTDQLGTQVRQAVEVLVQALDRADQDRGRNLLQDVSPERLYNAALTVMMRLVFLFCAEERGLLLLGDPVYDAYYSVSALRGQLREEANRIGIEVLERRQDAWARLLATFRGVYSGIRHETLGLPALDGSLFDPDHYPFLEGRKDGTSWKDAAATPLPIDNLTVLHLLESLQLLRRKGGRGPLEARRLSFRALDIEQIGHVYEGLLDHVAVRVESPTVGLKGAQGYEPEIALDDLEQKQAEGEQELLDFLREKTRRSESALRNVLNRIPEDEARERLRVASGSDEELVDRVLPYYALLRDDVWGYPVVYQADSFMVTGGPERRETGTHYTPRSLTETIVAETLTPLVYEGPAEGRPREAWKLRSPRHLLDLKICDMAMGSGAFLVQVCRWLSERLVESWEQAEDQGKVILAEGTLADEAGGQDLLLKNRDERLLIARRLVAERCIYGVDVNPMAVELGKLSIWLVTMCKGRPFGFLDHSLRCGDSLLGIRDINQVRHFHMDPEHGKKLHHSLFDPTRHIEEAMRQALERRRELRSVRVIDIEDIREMACLYGESREALEKVEIIADLLIGCAIATAGKPRFTLESQLVCQLDRLRQWLTGSDDLRAELERESQSMLDTDRPQQLRPRRTLHWPIEFPEVFIRENPGFDAILGNPPFMGGQKITGSLGSAYREHLVTQHAGGKRGSADLCAYFFLRATGLLRVGGMLGMLATNTIAQGDTREVGLEQILEHGFTIPCAVQSRKWPGGANLEVAIVWLRKGHWRGEHVLEGRTVPGITAFLTVPGEVTGKPYRLKANENKSFQGSIVLGMGFVLTPEEAQRLIDKDPKNKDVLFPYLNGEDLNSRPDQSASRWVINFFDWPLRRGAKGNWESAEERQQKEWLREGIVPDDYRHSVAADYPYCLAIIEQKVKPERTRKNENGEYQLRYPLYLRWWQYAEKRPKLYATIAGMERVICIPETTKFLAFSFCASGIVFSHAVKIITSQSAQHFALLSSSMHQEWAITYSSTLENRLKYITTDAYETFPFPESLDELEDIGKALYGHRASIMRQRQEGLTAIDNRLHNPDETADGIQRLRDLQIAMDKAVAVAYGWNDLDLGHDFYQTRQGVRFTISEDARREVIARLLRLNHQRYQEEVEQGLHS